MLMSFLGEVTDRVPSFTWGIRCRIRHRILETSGLRYAENIAHFADIKNKGEQMATGADLPHDEVQEASMPFHVSRLRCI